MQFDNKNKWYEQLVPDVHAQAFLVGRQGNPAQLLTQPRLRNLPIVRMEQVHGSTVCVLREQPHEPETILANTDAILTQLPGVVLEVRVADCLPVVVYHPSGLIGVVHAGRKGTQLGILQKTLEMVRDELGFRDGLQLWFGPAICKEHYQVERAQDLHFDLVGENKKQIAAVFSPRLYELTETKLCTVCNTKDFFSYRKEDTKQRNHVFVFRDTITL